MRIVGILLAAGSGSRFGGDKLRHPIRENLRQGLGATANALPLGVAACRNLIDALPDSIAVVRVGDVALNALLGDAGARVIECADAASGMGRSLACAIAATRDADGWVVALADMPWVSAATIRAIAGALQAGAMLAAPSFNGVRGNPVGFSSACAEALMRLEGDRGARDLVAAAGALLQIIHVDDAGVLRDVDVAADLQPRATRPPAA